MSREETDCIKSNQQTSSSSSTPATAMAYPPFYVPQIREQGNAQSVYHGDEAQRKSFPYQSNLEMPQTASVAFLQRYSPVSRDQQGTQRASLYNDEAANIATGTPILSQHLDRQTLVSQSKRENPVSSTKVVHQHDITTNFSEEKIIIKRRFARKRRDPERVIMTKSSHLDLKSEYLVLYLNFGATDADKVQMCADLVALDVEIQFRYDELDLQELLDKNMVRRRINCLTQTLGILEKYASNLIKPNRPAFWRTVKFTSSLVRAYLDNVHGSYDVLKKMGYTKTVPDGLSFPDDVKSPDSDKVKVLAADLLLAKYEMDELVHERHPYLEIMPLQSSPDPRNTKASDATTSEESESEYEDADDGLSTATEARTSELPQEVAISDLPPVSDEKICFVCGENTIKFSCEECDEVFCENCVKRFHNNKRRINHKVSEIGSNHGDDGKRKSSPSSSNALFENYNEVVKPPLKSVVQPRQQLPPRMAKKPIPKPRKRIPSAGTTGGNQRTTPVSPSLQAMDVQSPGVGLSHPSVHAELPPPPSYARRPLPQTILQTGTQGGREIKRPPPFDGPSTFNTPDESYESLKFVSEHLYETLDHIKGDSKGPKEDILPPPLPPPRRSEQPPRSSEQTVSSCPECFCLNEQNVTYCVACGASLSLPPSGNKDNNTLQAQTLRTHSDPLPGQAFENLTYGQSISKIPGQSSSASNLPGRPVQMIKKWECVHCTFHNDMGSKVCEVCSKTTDNPAEVYDPSSAPAALQSYDPISPGSTPYDPTPPRSTPFVPVSPRTIPYSPIPQKSTPFDPISPRTTAYDPVSPRSTPYSSVSPRSTGGSAVLQPSYIQLQEDALSTIQTKPNQPIPSTTNLTLQQLQLQVPPRNLLQQTREISENIHSIPVVQQRPVENLPSYLQGSPSSYRSSSGYGSQELEIDEMKEAGQQFVKYLKEAETLGFTPEEVNIAYLHQDETKGPVVWLQTEWFDRIHQVMIEFTNISKEENYGNISPEEAREALTEHTGVVKDASQKCVKDRKEKLAEVIQSGVYVRTDVIKALDMNDGDVEQAIEELKRMTFEPMLQRIKNSCIEDNVDNRERPLAARQMSTTQDDENFEAIVSSKDIDMDRRIRVMFAEKNFISWGRATTAIKLIDMSFPVLDSIEAAKVNGDMERSLQFLQRECNICFDTYPESRMVTMLYCQCRFCQPCVSQYFRQVIHEQNIMKLVCPQCDEPKNLEDATVAAEYFNHVDILVRRCVDIETHDLFQRKLRDRTLIKEPNFRWCSHCSSGFINEQPEVLKMACPNCRKYTCFKCKKQWEDQHEGISCEDFAAWKEGNDPEAQANGLAAHLKQNGIECPNCKFRYDLAKGGCMHFKCVQCSHEFCSGCYQPFRHNQHCPVSADCARRGLHAHHPRDCLFYLRDRDPKQLKKLLDDNNVQYNTEPPQRQPTGTDDEAQGAAAAAADTGRCKVMEQRDAAAGLEDVECGRETPPGYAGLCRLHFIEYLVELINSNLIDPVGIFSIDEIKAVLTRNDQEVPAKRSKENKKDYEKRIVLHLQEKLPLPRKTPRKRVLDVDEGIPVFQAQAAMNALLINHEQQDGFYYGDDDFGSELSYEPDSGAEQSDE